jgi:chromosome segregation ATPase
MINYVFFSMEIELVHTIFPDPETDILHEIIPLENKKKKKKKKTSNKHERQIREFERQGPTSLKAVIGNQEQSIREYKDKIASLESKLSSLHSNRYTQREYENLSKEASRLKARNSSLESRGEEWLRKFALLSKEIAERDEIIRIKSEQIALLEKANGSVRARELAIFNMNSSMGEKIRKLERQLEDADLENSLRGSKTHREHFVLKSTCDALTRENEVMKRELESLRKEKEEELKLKKLECCICMEKVIDTVYVKCGHACVCTKCSPNTNGLCPICRAATSTIKIHLYSVTLIDKTRVSLAPNIVIPPLL